uniref:KH-like RNA-binding domain-containing protein n=1 Tax=Equus caballus TaxID=9796 RepID=A0A3Q2GWH6_HORSE
RLARAAGLPGSGEPGAGRGAAGRLPLGRCARAVDAAAAARARGEGRTPAEALAGLLRRTPPTPRARPRPWWFPARELSGPSACYLEARLAGCVFGPDRAAVPETESRSQALLTARAVEPGSAVEVTVFGQPHGQNRVKGVLQSLAAWHRERRTRGEKMEQLEAFLKARAPRPQPPAHPVA